MKNNQIGRSMIEMLGVLSIIGVLSVGGFSLVKKMQNSYDTNRVIEEISSFVRKARIVVREYDGSENNLNSYIYSGKSYPEGMDYNSSTGFSGTSGVNYSFTKGTDGVLFVMTVSQLPEDVCMQIATADWGNTATSGFKGIEVGSESSTTPLDLGTAAEACGDNATVKLSFR